MNSWIVLAIASVVMSAACSAAGPTNTLFPTSTPPSAASPAVTAVSTPPVSPLPTPSTAVVSDLVGEWEMEQACEQIVERLTDAGMDAWALEYAAAFVPGASSGEDIVNPSKSCNGAVPLRHSHFFTADGEFGSRDQKGAQVDAGRYRIVDESSFVISNELEPGKRVDVTFHYDVTGDTITFEPVIPNCRPDCFEAVWSVTVAYEGLPWTRVSPSPSLAP